jgi:hypothetical protein
MFFFSLSLSLIIRLYSAPNRLASKGKARENKKTANSECFSSYVRVCCCSVHSPLISSFSYLHPPPPLPSPPPSSSPHHLYFPSYLRLLRHLHLLLLQIFICSKDEICMNRNLPGPFSSLYTLSLKTNTYAR